jgi:hypothetical protein
VKASLSSLSPRAFVALLAGAVLLWTAALWFLYVSPQRSTAADLREQVAGARAELAQGHGATHRSTAAPASDVLRLAKAMPSSGDQSGLVLELTRLADASHVTLGSIASEAAAEGPGGTTMIPVTVTLSGRFAQVTRFVKHARTLVSVRHGKVLATGRLFSVQSVDLTESVARGFPQLDATIVLDAFVYDGPIKPVTPSHPASDSTGGDTSTSSDTSAAGGTGS